MGMLFCLQIHIGALYYLHTLASRKFTRFQPPKRYHAVWCVGDVKKKKTLLQSIETNGLSKARRMGMLALWCEPAL